MTRIDFYHDAADKLHAALRIVRKAVAQGHRVVCYVPDASTGSHLDRLLWAHPPTGFLPHCRADSPLAGETPVLLASSLADVAADDVLINLDAAVPPGFARFQRLIDIVGDAEADKAPGRERYRFYRDRGYEIARHDLAAPR